VDQRNRGQQTIPVFQADYVSFKIFLCMYVFLSVLRTFQIFNALYAIGDLYLCLIFIPRTGQFPRLSPAYLCLLFIPRTGQFPRLSPAFRNTSSLATSATGKAFAIVKIKFLQIHPLMAS
jgi:hypothetical protein